MKLFSIGDIVKTPDGIGKIAAIVNNRRSAIVTFHQEDTDTNITKTYNIATLNKGD